MQQSAAFFAAADRCLTERPCVDGLLSIIFAPGIVCSALSIELAFKAMIIHSGHSGSKEHNLSKLFQKLSPWRQNEIIQAVASDKETFVAELEKMSVAFLEWRYVYEYPEVQINLGFMGTLAKAVQKAARNAISA
jgi:HEPN domain-containing protein